ncbi:hypothetical protein SGLAD_v1c01880 [Spiroplasma gladiatoris]|uniref:Uncharacterized protein n=1 Tax=Spiroplasma gladiatoris TaxID=2143 RepID=A0A4P7AGW8_9MOLU|nr:hypothetical protein [Spiroplasma gladiatoris]QBQ07387.1 hypothetical protein SGLAD_v1c01880 [Spiroplasma gladiatoris]
MFLRNTGDISYYLKRTSWIKYLDEGNLNYRSKMYIKKIGKKINDQNVYNSFKYWVLWRWINKNFEFSETFVSRLRRNIKKLSLNIDSKEETFLYELDELVFNAWRPLKEVPVRFELDKKEKINLLQTEINVHKLIDLKETKLKMLGNFNAYFSSQAIYLTDYDQNLKHQIPYNQIINVNPKRYGIVIETMSTNYLFRGRNKLLTFVILQRMLPKLKLDISKIENLYDYFDFWNRLFSRIN